MAIANNVDLTTVSRLYTAFFNRAPDTAGLSFWANALANGASVSTVTQGFLTAPEGVAQYPAFQNGEQFISAFYTKVFGRAADAEGLAFWTAALNNLGGAESTAAKAAVASQIISVVSTPLSEADAALPANAQTVQDRALFANKVEIGTYLATNAAVSEENANGVFTGTYPVGSSPIDATIGSVDVAKAAFYSAQIADPAIKNVVGSDGNDVFTISDLTTYAGRTLDGGKGIDTLILNGTIGTPADNQVTNVEIIRLAGVTGTADVSKFVGSTDISVSDSTASLTGLADKKLTFLNDASTVNADYGDTATTAAVVLNSKDTSASELTLAGSKLTSATLSGTGAITFNAPSTLTTLNVAATGAIILAASTVGTIDASTSTGAVTAEVGANQVYKGGSGIDTVVLSATPSKAITGGAGDNDVLVVNGTAATVVLNAGITGFETLGFGDKATGSYDAANFKHLLVSNEVGGALTADNVAAGTDVTFTTGSVTPFTYNLANSEGTSDAVNVKLSAAAPIQVSFEAAGVETVNITSTNTATGDASHGVQLLASDATSVVVTGNAGLELLTTDGKITSFDASAVTGNVGVKYQSTNETVNASVSIKGSLTGANELGGNDATNDTIIGGAAADTIVGTAGKDVLTGGAGNDTFVLAPNIQEVTGGSSLIFTTITDAAQGDILNLGDLSNSGSFTETTLNRINSVETATYADFLDLATTGNGTASAIGSWFQVGGDTYIVVDNSAGPTFAEGQDQVVKLTGLVDVETLNVQLGNA